MDITKTLQVQFDNSYHRDMEGFYVPWQGVVAPKPQTIQLNYRLAKELGLNFDDLTDSESANIFSGGALPGGAAPLAQVYAGHQFGGFSPRLGDGRALLIGEVLDINGIRMDIQLKGSGRTPFSRGGDGKAAIGPVLREYLVSEAMHALGVPTTRSLAAVTTGEEVIRETLLPGAVLTRVATSHLRVGTFEYFAARNETEKVRQLADYAICRHYPSLAGQKDQYLQFLIAVLDVQATLVAKWMSIGFIHGVMNTDNSTISGETIDYGPCAFMDHYDPDTVFSSIDTQGRYAYQNQPTIAVWNLSRLAETLLPLIDDNEDVGIEKASGVLNTFSQKYFDCWLQNMRQKLGFMTERKGDMDIARQLFKSMEDQRVDFTSLFLSLAPAVTGEVEQCKSLFDDSSAFEPWLGKWAARISEENMQDQARLEMMRLANPIYIPRNHKVEEALEAATNESNYTPFKTLLKLLESPFKKQQVSQDYELPAPESHSPYRTFCGT